MYNLWKELGAKQEDLPVVLVIGMLEAVVAHHAGGVLAAVLAGVRRIADAEESATKYRRAVGGGKFLNRYKSTLVEIWLSGPGHQLL